MAKEFWEDDEPLASAPAPKPAKGGKTAAPAADADFWKADADIRQGALPAGVTPSAAGGGRGTVNPPLPPAEAPLPPSSADPMGSGAAEIQAAASAPTRDMRPLVERAALKQAEEGVPYDREALIRQSRRSNYAQTAARSRLLTEPSEARPSTDPGERSYARAAGDTALGVFQGGVGMVKGVADNVNAGANPVSEFLDGFTKKAENLKSPQLRSEQTRRAGRIGSVQRDQGELGAARAAFQTLFEMPAAALDVGAQGAGSLVPTLMMGAAGAGPRLMAAVNAASTAGESAASTAERLRKAPMEAWAENPAYAALTTGGMQHDQAVSLLAPIYAIPAQAAGALAGAISGSSGAERVIAGRATGATIGDRIRRMAAEHAGEQLETVLPGVAGNLAQGAVDGTTPWNQGLGQGVVDTAAGTMGPGALAARASRPATQAAAQPQTAPVAPPSPAAEPVAAPAGQPIAAALPPLPPPPRPGTLTRAAQTAPILAQGGPIDPAVMQKTEAEANEAMAQIAAIEQQQDDEAALEAALLQDRPLGERKAKKPNMAQARPETDQPSAVKPEPRSDTAAQVEAVRDPSSAKKAALITPNSSMEGIDLTGLHLVKTHRGTFVTADVDLAREVAGKRDTISDEEMGKALGYTTRKTDTDGTVVQATDRAGNVVHEEATNKANLAQAIDRAGDMAPKGGTVTTTDAPAALARREDLVKKEAPHEAKKPKKAPAAKARKTAAPAGDVGAPARQGDADATRAAPVQGAGAGAAAAPTGRAEGADGAADGPAPAPQGFGSVDEAAAYIKDQRKRGTNITAVPVVADDGAVRVAIKGSPEYERGLAQQAERQQAAERADAGILDGDILAKSGGPFKAKIGAVTARKRAGEGHDIVEVKGGWVVRQGAKSERTDRDMAAVPGGGDRAAGPDGGAGLGDRVGAAGAADGAVPAGRGAAGAPVAPAAPAGDDADAVVEHTTPKGKVLRGFVRQDLTGDEARAIDPYAFRKNGGWFIREKHREQLPPLAPPLAAQQNAALFNPDRATQADDAQAEAKAQPKAGKVDKPGDREGTGPEATPQAYDGPTMDEIRAIADMPTVEVMAEAQRLIGTEELERRAQAKIDDYSKGGKFKVSESMMIEAAAREVVAVSRRAARAVEAAATTELDRDIAAQGVNLNPTEGQKEAGNYKKAHVTVLGLDMTVENPKGSTRSGVNKAGVPWSHKMSHAYGYVKRTEAADGDHHDVYLGPKPEEATHVYVVDQIDQGTGKFDETKSMVGFMSQAAAIAAYRKNFDKGWKVGPVTAMPVEQWKAFINDPATQKKPANEAAFLALQTPGRAEQLAAEVAQLAPDRKPEPAAAPSAPRPRATPAQAAKFMDAGQFSDEQLVQQARAIVGDAQFDAWQAEHLKAIGADAGDASAANKLLSSPVPLAIDILATQPKPAKKAAEPKPKKETKAAREAREAEEARAAYFAPGNIVRSYGGFDRVISYTPPEQPGGRWSVTVRAVVERDGKWIDATGEQERTHSTQPEARLLKNGPRGRVAPTKTPAERIAEWREQFPSKPPSGMTVQELSKFVQARRDAEAELARELGEQAEGLVVPTGYGHVGVTRDTSEPDKWRITRFDRDMEPSGHEVYNTRFEAVMQAINRYRPLEEAKAAPAAAPAPTAPAEATHADPGQAPEPATPAVVAEAVAKGAKAEAMKPSEIRAELLRQIDAAIAAAPKADDTIGSTPAHTERGHKTFTTARGTFNQPGYLQLRIVEGSNDKWGVHYRHGRDSLVHEFKADGVAEARSAAEALIARAELNGEKVTFGGGNFITLDVPGDGKFRVTNTVERLQAFRAQVEKSPGFSDKGQATVKPKPASAASAGTVAALQNMVEEGDYQAALDYATAKGTSLDELKLTKPERKKLDDWLKTNPQPTTEADDVVEPPTEPAPSFEESFLNDLYGEGREAPAEPPASAPQPVAASERASRKPRASAEPKPAAQPGEARIEDFGETLHGARKMLYAEAYRDQLGKAKDLDLASQPLSKTWPEPDYQKLLDNGADAWAVGFARAVRDEVPNKPGSSWKLKGWVEKVQALRTLAEDVMASPESLARVRAELDKAKYLRLNQELAGKVALYQALGHARSLRGISVESGSYSVFAGVHYSPAKTFYTVEQSTKATPFGNMGRTLAVGETMQEAVDKFAPKAMAFFEAEARKKGEGAPAGTKFELYAKRGAKENPVFIGKKIGRNVVSLKEGFASTKEARAWMAEHQAELEALLAKKKEVPPERRETNEPRVGADHRHNGDVSPEQFADAFGFRGVQFGNYVEGPRRQADLNRAYDSLMDLAAMIGVPPRALSLNGELGLAFGARGHGGKKAPAAHYETGNVVINLTKDGGAGSLAHEWWHALDNYFGRLDQRNGVYMTDAPDGKGPLRLEMREAFRFIKRTLTNLPMKDRSESLDATRTKPYWATPLEMSARAFEAYVVAKLQDQGARNDYLANIVPEAMYERPEDYPYPKVDELPQVRAAFDRFIETVEARPGPDGRVALLSPAVPGAAKGRTIDADGAAQLKVAKLRRVMMEQHQGAEHLLDFRAVELVNPGAREKFRQLQGLARSLWGHEVVLVQFDGDPFFNGVYLQGGQTVYLNVDSPYPFKTVLGHELLHGLRNSQPALYAQLHERLRDAMHDGAYDTHFAALARAYVAMGQRMPTEWEEELIADIVGDNFVDPAFWEGLAVARMGWIDRVLDAAAKWLVGLLDKLRGRESARPRAAHPFGTDAFIRDAEAARSAVVDAMAKFAQRRNGAEPKPQDIAVESAAHQREQQVRQRAKDDEMLSRWGIRPTTSLSIASHAAAAPGVAKAAFDGAMSYTRDEHGRAVKVDDLRERYKDLTANDKGKMLLGARVVTEDQLKRWQASRINVYDGAVNKRFERHFLSPGVVWNDAELTAQGLDAAAIAAYRDLRVQADTSIAANAQADMLRAAGQDAAAVREQVHNEPLDVAAETLRDHLLNLAEAEPQRNAMLIKAANRVIDIADEATERMERGFVPDQVKPTVIANPWEPPAPSKMDRLIYELQDGKIDIKRTQQAIEATGRTIDEQFDARLAETLYAGRVAKRSHAFVEHDVQPLLRAMSSAKVSQTELGDFLHARAAPERNAQIAKVNPDMPDGGAGKNSQGLLLTTQAAIDYIAAIPADRREVLMKLAAQVDAITKATRQLLVAEGLEKAETIAAWEGAYKNYVPMFREDVEFRRLTTFKRATGSEQEAVNILAHVFLQREAAISRAERNRILVALYGLALSNPNPDFWATIRPSQDAEAIKADLVRMGIDPVVAEAGMQGVPTITDVDPVTGKVVQRLNPMYKQERGAIVLKVNGEYRVLMLNKGNERAMRMADALKSADGLTRLDIAGSLIGRVTRWMAAVNTQYNPAFGLVNFWRDTTGGIVNLTNTALRYRKGAVMAGLPGALRGITAHEMGRPDATKWSKLFEQFQQDGGQTGFRELFRDGGERAARIERELARMGQSKLRPMALARAVFGLLDGFNTVMENAVRLSAYAVALDQGMSRANAARLARELTVDFNRKGRATREVGPLYAFFNASVQGTERTLRALAGPAGARIIAGGLALGVIQALLLAAAGYEDDEIPGFVKARALIIPLFNDKKNFISIPLPLGLHVLPNTGRIITEMVIGDHKKLAHKAVDAIGEIAGAFNPLGGGNIFTTDGALKTVMPTVIDPLIELSANRNFAGYQIEREARGEGDHRPGSARAKESTLRTTTGQAYLGISQFINRATGGSDVEQGLASPTPERIRYLAQVAGGGVLRELEKVINSSAAATAGAEVPLRGVPIVSRFYGEVEGQQVTSSRYYDMSKRIDKVEGSIRAARKAGDGDTVERLMGTTEGQFIKTGNNVAKALAKLNKMAVENVGDRTVMKAIDEQREAEMRKLTDSLLEFEAAANGPTLAKKVRSAVVQ